MKKAHHVHKYKKVNIGTNGKEYLVYRCTKPICSHYMPIAIAEGKLCECNRCGEPMIITREVLTHSGKKPMAKPHCPDCIKRRKSIVDLSDYLNKAGVKASE